MTNIRLLLIIYHIHFLNISPKKYLVEVEESNDFVQENDTKEETVNSTSTDPKSRNETARVDTFRDAVVIPTRKDRLLKNGEKRRSSNGFENTGIKNGHKYETPRLLKLKIYLDDSKVEEYKKMYGRNYKEEATSEMKQLLKSASKLLRQLDNDGFELKLDGPLVVLSESPLMVGKTYFDRADYNKEKPLDVNHEDFTLGMAFALQDRIKSIKDFQHLPDTLIFLITSFKKGRILEAATEENCICASPPDFPCIGIWANDDMSKGALLAHEVAHALGAELHDPKWSNTIMADAVHSWFTDWSQFSKDQINRQDNTCLNKVEREKLILENSMNEDEYESDRRSGAIQMENINKNPRKNVRDCIPPCRQPE